MSTTLGPVPFPFAKALQSLVLPLFSAARFSMRKLRTSQQAASASTMQLSQSHVFGLRRSAVIAAEGLSKIMQAHHVQTMVVDMASFGSMCFSL